MGVLEIILFTKQPQTDPNGQNTARIRGVLRGVTTRWKQTIDLGQKSHCLTAVSKGMAGKSLSQASLGFTSMGCFLERCPHVCEAEERSGLAKQEGSKLREQCASCTVPGWQAEPRCRSGQTEVLSSRDPRLRNVATETQRGFRLP